MFKYISAELASVFANTLRVRFTQPFELNDPFELRPLIDFKATADEFRADIEAKTSEMFKSVDSALAAIERRQDSDPSFPQLPVSFKSIPALIAANPILEQQFAADFQRYKAKAMDEITKA